MSQFLGTDEFEVIVLYMEVTMVNDYHYAHNRARRSCNNVTSAPPGSKDFN